VADNNKQMPYLAYNLFSIKRKVPLITEIKCHLNIIFLEAVNEDDAEDKARKFGLSEEEEFINDSEDDALVMRYEGLLDLREPLDLTVYDKSSETYQELGYMEVAYLPIEVESDEDITKLFVEKAVSLRYVRRLCFD
jgi:hypothetical protein